MATTPAYGWRYLALADPPNIAQLGEDLALDVEGTVQDVQSDVTALGVDVTAIQAVLDAPGTDYSSSFVIGASVTPPTKGTLTTYAASYFPVGQWVDYGFNITIDTGGGWNPGSGSWYFPVPITAHVRALAQAVGPVYVADQGTALVVGVCFFDTVDRLTIVLQSVPGALLGASGPGTAWATSDFMRASIRYERA